MAAMFRRVGVELPVLVEQADDGPCEQQETERRRDGEKEPKAQAAPQHRTEISAIFCRCDAGEQRQSHGTDSHPEDP
jgi:hypothetical protein